MAVAQVKPPKAVSAKPGMPGPAEADPSKAPKKEKTQRVAWGQRDAEGSLVTKLSWSKGQALPESYDSKKNNPLRRDDFASTADYYEFQADYHERKGTELRQAAADERSGIGKTTRAKQKKLLKLRESCEALIKELQAAGVDVSAALAVGAK